MAIFIWQNKPHRVPTTSPRARCDSGCPRDPRILASPVTERGRVDGGKNQAS